MLTQDLITYGKYKNKTINSLLKDRKYCLWLGKQEWLKKDYEYIYNKINEYKPLDFFIKKYEKQGNFINDYTFFNLINPKDIKLPLNNTELLSYQF